MRNLYRLKVTDQAGTDYKTHTVADSRYQAIVSLKDHLETIEGSTAVIEVAQVGDVESMPETVKPGLPGKLQMSEEPKKKTPPSHAPGGSGGPPA